MKEDTAKTLGYAFGVITVVLLIGFMAASFVTFVVGMFVAYEFTLLNILKVWAGLIALNLVLVGVKSK